MKNLLILISTILLEVRLIIKDICLTFLYRGITIFSWNHIFERSIKS